MEKSMSGSNSLSTSTSTSGNTSGSKDAFKNTPHVGSQVLGDAKNSIMDQAQPAVDFVKQNFSNVQDSAKDYFDASTGVIRSNPFYAILGAAAIGVGLGMWISSSRSSSN